MAVSSSVGHNQGRIRTPSSWAYKFILITDNYCSSFLHLVGFRFLMSAYQLLEAGFRRQRASCREFCRYSLSVCVKGYFYVQTTSHSPRRATAFILIRPKTDWVLLCHINLYTNFNRLRYFPSAYTLPIFA